MPKPEQNTKTMQLLATFTVNTFTGYKTTHFVCFSLGVLIDFHKNVFTLTTDYLLQRSQMNISVIRMYMAPYLDLGKKIKSIQNIKLIYFLLSTAKTGTQQQQQQTI